MEVSPTPAEDNFWIEYAKSSIKYTIQVLDERAKYVITTCASLVVIHFGLLLAFKVEGISLRVTPEFFFVISAALFAMSLYPVGRRINIQSPDTAKIAYDSWIKWKLTNHRIGFGFLIAGLLGMAISSMTVNFTP